MSCAASDGVQLDVLCWRSFRGDAWLFSVGRGSKAWPSEGGVCAMEDPRGLGSDALGNSAAKASAGAVVSSDREYFLLSNPLGFETDRVRCGSGCPWGRGAVAGSLTCTNLSDFWSGRTVFADEVEEKFERMAKVVFRLFWKPVWDSICNQ